MFRNRYIYALGITLLLIVILMKSDFIEKIKYKFGIIENPISGHGYYMWSQSNYFQKRSQSMTSDPKIIFIGDSITNMLSVETVFNAVNFGISGDTVKRMKSVVKTYKNLEGKIIVLALGINDIPRDSNEIFEDYKELIENVPNTSTILISSILPIDEKSFFEHWKTKKTNSQISEINEMLHSYSLTKNNVFYSDTAILLRNTHNKQLRADYHSGDGIHLNMNGYEQWIIGLKCGLKDIVDKNFVKEDCVKL